jgi:predicted lipid-binding transport protein (Tim44 family)
MKTLAITCSVLGAMALTVGSAAAQNHTYCHNQAMAAANQIAEPAAGGVLGGLLGGTAGAVGGAVLGQGSEAKALGAIAGGVAGAAIGTNAQKKKKQQVYDQTYANCMSAAAPVVYGPVPAAGTPQWVADCSVKYKSFIADPNSPYFGTYQPYASNGVYPPRRPCELP